MTLTGIYFILGMCVMFYFMMTWLFLRKNSELLSRLAALLMFVIGIQSLKDLFFFQLGDGLDDYLWMVIHLKQEANKIRTHALDDGHVEYCVAVVLSMAGSHRCKIKGLRR